MDDVHLTEREQRLLRREQLKADIAQKEREIQERTNENRLKKIKQRDRNIEMLQLKELQRQRNELIEKRRHARQERDEQHRVVEEQRIELRDKSLRTQSRTSDIESQRLKETVIDIKYEDDELKGACGHTNIDSDIKRMEFGENSRYTKRTYTDQSLITINEYEYVDRERTMPKDQNHCKYFDQFSTVSNDTVDKGSQWLRRKKIQLEEEHHANSEDRIKIEGEINRTQGYQLIHKCNKRDMDFKMEMETLQKQIELMKLEEREAVRKIQIKEELRETKQKEKLQAEQRKQNEDRLRTLKQEKYELEQSLLEKQSVLSSLAEE
ncbi:hypothetical protein DPMN_016411 [Dreissena polymorpha]|uniref:Uncharacterized protein n=1 Tax=Dreissena polymorpha TaxID=45954 RepID=A0A9D4NCW2_DREPO|nr:hypothetical protein DPMN_016411 [Dreissena polymorpha]